MKLYGPPPTKGPRAALVAFNDEQLVDLSSKSFLDEAHRAFQGYDVYKRMIYIDQGTVSVHIDVQSKKSAKGARHLSPGAPFDVS